MKFSVPTADLRAAIAPVARATAARSASPMLTGALMSVSGNTLTLTGTDTNISVTATITATECVDGSALVPASLLAQLSSSAAGETITIESLEGDNAVEFRSGRAKSKIRTMDTDGFPQMTVSEGATIEVPSKDVIEALDAVSYALSSDETRGVLHGVYVDTATETPTLVATDSLRLASCELPTWAAPSDAGSVIVPSRAIDELVRKPLGEKVAITITPNLINFTSGALSITSRLISGDYPNWRPLLAGERDRVFTLNVKETVEALKRIDPMTKGSNHVQVTISDSEATLAANGAEGSMTDVVTTTSEGDEFVFRVNPKYLQEALLATGSDVVEIYHNGDSTRPLELRRPGSTAVRSLMMPIRVV